jgi:hypothetical protein
MGEGELKAPREFAARPAIMNVSKRLHLQTPKANPERFAFSLTQFSRQCIGDVDFMGYLW